LFQGFLSLAEKLRDAGFFRKWLAFCPLLFSTGIDEF